MTSYRTFFGIVLTMALLAASGCAEDMSSATADDEQTSSNVSALDNAPGDVDLSDYTPDELSLGHFVVDTMLAMPESQRVAWLVNQMPTHKASTGACIGGAIAIVGSVGGCAAGNPWSCVSAVGGAIAWAANCGDRDRHIPSYCVGHLC